MTTKRNRKSTYVRKGYNDRRGARNPFAKLNETKVRDIRKRFAAGESAKAIAYSYSIGLQTVYAVKSRQRWAHVE